MSVRLAQQAMNTDIPPGQRFVLVCLALRVNSKKEEKGTWPSMTTIVQETGISRRSVVSHIQWLQNHGHIKVIRGRDENGRKTVNRYILTLSATVAHGSSNDSAVVAPSPCAIHVQKLQVGSAVVALKQEENRKLKQEEEKLTQKEKDFPVWFKTLLGVDTVKGESPVTEKDFKPASSWANKKFIPEECLERAANYVDSDWRGGLKKRIKVLATFYNAAIKEYGWSKNNGFNGNRVPKTSADADFIPGVTPSPLL